MKTASAAARFTFPVASFRHIETPFQKQGYKDFLAVVDLSDLPDLSAWRKINVRDPKLTGAVPKAIRESVRDNGETFVFLNRGIVLAVDSASFDNHSGKLTITLSDPELHGLLDGGHTYNILMQERSSLESPQYVKVEMLEGFDHEEIVDLVDARNTSNQVRDQSLMNLQGEFEEIKKHISREPYASLIAYKEHEILDDGSAKPIDIREIVAVLTCFDRVNFDARVHPIIAYSSKAACLNHFKAHVSDYRKIFPIASDVLAIFDSIQLYLPDLYNKVRSKSGEVKGGKFGNLTGVTKYDGKRRTTLPFIEEKSEYSVPTGFTYPVLGAFRALLEDKSDRYSWGKGIDPIRLLKGQLGETLADTIGNFALDARNPSKTGKSALVWQACYQAAQVAYLSRP